MKKLLTTAALALPLMGAIGAGAAVAATGAPQAAIETHRPASLVQKVGFVDAYGNYVCVWHPVIVGYDFRGWPIVRQFCD